MTTNKENSPATAPTVNRGETKSIPERSVITAYMPDPRNHTGIDYATISGIKLPRTKYMEVLIPLKDVHRIIDGEKISMIINSDCLDANDRIVQERKEQERVKAEKFFRNKLSRELEEVTYAEEIQELADQLDAIYRRIDKEVDNKIKAGGKIS